MLRSTSSSSPGGGCPWPAIPTSIPTNPYGGGWAFADGKLVPMYQDRPGEDHHTLHYKAADARTWSKPGEVEVFVFPRYNWWNNIVPIKSVDRDEPDHHAGRRRLVPDPARRPLLLP